MLLLVEVVDKWLCYSVGDRVDAEYYTQYYHNHAYQVVEVGMRLQQRHLLSSSLEIEKSEFAEENREDNQEEHINAEVDYTYAQVGLCHFGWRQCLTPQ